MEKYDIKIYPAAKKDMIRIVEYINELSPKAAEEQYDRLVAGILSLKYMPRRCSTLKNNFFSKKGYRFLRINNYLVIFIVSKNIVEIRRIIYCKQNYDFFINLD